MAQNSGRKRDNRIMGTQLYRNRSGMGTSGSEKCLSFSHGEWARQENKKTRDDADRRENGNLVQKFKV